MISVLIYFLTIAFCLLMVTYYRSYYVANFVKGKGTVEDRVGLAMIFIAACLPLVIVGGFRDYSVGTDTYGIYYPYYFVPLLHGENPSITDYGFVYMMKVCIAVFGNRYTVWLIVLSTFITVFSIVAIVRASKDYNVFYFALIYFCFIYFASFNIARQMCAVTVLAASLHLIGEHKPVKFLIVVVIMCLLHNSAIICLLIPFFYLIRNSRTMRKVVPWVIIALPFCLPLILQVFNTIPYFQRYILLYGQNLHIQVSLVNLSQTIYYLPAYIVIWANRKNLLAGYDRYGNVSEYNRTMNYVLLMMTLTCLSCNLFKLSMVWIARLGYYFLLSFCFLLPQCERFYRNKKLYRTFIVIYCIIYFIWFYIIRLNHNIFPYQFI